MATPAKKQKQIPFNLAIAIILFFVICGLYWYTWKSVTTDVDVLMGEIDGRIIISNRGTNDTKKQMMSLLSDKEKTGKYGQWPLENVPLSDGRGNPFTKKNK